MNDSNLLLLMKHIHRSHAGLEGVKSVQFGNVEITHLWLISHAHFRKKKEKEMSLRLQTKSFTYKIYQIFFHTRLYGQSNQTNSTDWISIVISRGYICIWSKEIKANYIFINTVIFIFCLWSLCSFLAQRNLINYNFL